MAKVRFLDLPRHLRREAVIRLKNRIRLDDDTPSDRFWTPFYWADLQKGGCDWLDLLFLGQGPLTYWNTCFVTIDRAHEFWIQEMTRREIDQMFPTEEKELTVVGPFTSGPAEWHKEGKRFIRWWPLVIGEAPPLQSLGGLTVAQYQDRMFEEIRANRPPEIRDSFHIRRNYCNGIGLFAIVDA